MKAINLASLKAQIEGYPRQFWVLFWGLLINTAGASMVWPFMTIYLRQQLDVPLTTVTLLMTINATANLIAVAVVGPVVDRFGRKGAMVVGLATGAVIRVSMTMAGTLPAWAILMALQGAFGPLYQVGADAMIADMIPPERRQGAYALLRTIANLGIAIGPAVGGFIAAASYTTAFYIAAGGAAIFALLILTLTRETIPRDRPNASGEPAAPGAAAADSPRRQGGYGPVLHDRHFMAFFGLFTLTGIAPAVLMVLLPVYAKEQFGIPESQYGFIMATNAAMVVLFQYVVTQISKRYSPGPVLAVGALFYGLGAGSVAWGASFPAFWTSMVVLTLGELLMVPTATALTASMAPADMRGRYMGVYSLGWGIAYGIGPVMGGVLSDRIAPVATWYGGLAAGLIAAVGFALLATRLRKV